MLKISSKGLEEYKEIYYQEITKKINVSKIDEAKFYNKDLKDYLKNNLDNILIGNIDKLKKIIKEMNEFLPADKFYDFCKYLFTTNAKSLTTFKNKIKEYNDKGLSIDEEDANSMLTKKGRMSYLEKNYNEIYKILQDRENIKNLFKYSYISDLKIRNTILNKIGINICPYCGRQFISSYDKDGEEVNSADLDHFYIKAEYPYLALSLFNFVPSCQICNLRMKNDKDFCKNEYLYPYKEGFESDAFFDIDNSVFIGDIINGKQDAKIIINRDKANKEKKVKIDNNIKTFGLESIYQNHSKDVQEIFRMIQIYSPAYLKDIAGVLYDNEDFDNEISKIEGELSKIRCGCNNVIIDELDTKLEKLRNNNKSMDLVMKAEDMMLLMFKEKDNDEILSKLYNDLLDKYWRDIK